MLSLLAAAFAADPIAEAGLPLLAYPDDKVFLNGAGSVDPDGESLFYNWVQTGGPPVVLDDADTATPSFYVPAGGTYRFSLVVADGTTDSAPDDVVVVVPEAGRDLYVEASGCSTTSGQPGLWLFPMALIGLRVRRRA